LRRRLGAIVEDEVLIDGTNEERRKKYGEGVGRRDSAYRPIEIWMPESTRNNVQRVVVIKYVEDQHTELAPRVFEV
jgi:hypothetical protein